MSSPMFLTSTKQRRSKKWGRGTWKEKRVLLRLGKRMRGSHHKAQLMPKAYLRTFSHLAHSVTIFWLQGYALSREAFANQSWKEKIILAQLICAEKIRVSLVWCRCRPNGAVHNLISGWNENCVTISVRPNGKRIEFCCGTLLWKTILVLLNSQSVFKAVVMTATHEYFDASKTRLKNMFSLKMEALKHFGCLQVAFN